MERFRFRVWDNSAKKMRRCAISQTGIVNFIERDDESEFISVGDEVARLHYIDVMQCTGLKDKKDKLIYEGDIVRYMNDFGNVFIWEVVFLEKPCSFNLKEKGQKIYHGFALRSQKEFEILGNIYEDKNA